MSAKTDSGVPRSARKPRWSVFFSTACYAGYLPKAPGTIGSLLGVLLYWATETWSARVNRSSPYSAIVWPLYVGVAVALLLAFAGVFVSSRAARWKGEKDPQCVVVDEVSGQFFTYLFALAPLNWKYLALGFILFRGFDIWKPFPARQAEALPGGWGIMADDWIAAIYAALGLWVARAIGL